MNRDRLAFAAALVAAALAAIVLRAWHLSAWPLWLDESWSRWMTEQSWAGLWEGAVRYDTHPPFYYALLKAWTCLAPSTPLWLRLPSVLAGLAMLPLAWACAGRIGPLRGNVWPRLAALALVAVSPPLIVGAAQARPYAAFALAFGLALWATLGLAAGAERSHRARLMLWALYLAGFEATLWLHSLGALFGAALAGGLLLALAAAGTLRRFLLPWLAVHAAAGLLWIPGLLILIEQRRNWSASSWLHFTFADVPPGLASGLFLPGAAALLLLLLAGLGVRVLLGERGDRPAGLLLLAAALLPAALTILLSILVSPVFLPRTLVPSVLPALLLAAAGLAAIGRAPVRAAVAAVILALMAASSFALASAAPEERWYGLSAWLGERVTAGEELWRLPNEIPLPFRYGGGGEAPYKVRGLPADFPAPAHPGPRPSGTKAVAGMTGEDAGRLVADARRRRLSGIWVVSRFPSLFDPGGTLPAAFGPGARDVRNLRFAPLIVDHYRLRPAGASRPAP